MKECKKEWKITYLHACQEFVSFEKAESVDEAIVQFRAKLVRLSPVISVELRSDYTVVEE